MYAAVAMAMSSISVVVSSLFLKLYDPAKVVRKFAYNRSLGAKTETQLVQKSLPYESTKTSENASQEALSFEHKA